MIEGALYALFPQGMQRMMAQALNLSPTVLRFGGLMFAILGFGVVYLIRL